VVAARLVGRPAPDWAWIYPVVTFALLLLVARWMWKRGILIRV
jgi:hypothetical protein